MKRNGFRDPAAALRSFKVSFPVLGFSDSPTHIVLLLIQRSLDAIRDTRDVRNLQKPIIDTRRSAFQFRFGAQEIALGHSIPPQIEFATYLKTPVDYLIERVDSMMVSEILGPGNFPWRTTFLNLFSIITAGSLSIASSGFGLVEATVTEDEIVYALYRMKQFLIDNVASSRPDIVHAMMRNLPPIPDNKFELQ